MSQADEFDRCWPWLEASLEFAAFKHDGRTYFSHEKRHVWERIASERCIFWPRKESAIITEFYTTPTNLKSHHTWLAGGELDDIVTAMPDVEDYGRQRGALLQTGSGRRGWMRKFEGYHEIGVRKAKSLLP